MSDVREALERARELHPGDPAAVERQLRRDGFYRAALIHQQARRRERERIRSCYELAEDLPPARREKMMERALSDDAPTAEELARELVEGEIGPRMLRLRSYDPRVPGLRGRPVQPLA